MAKIKSRSNGFRDVPKAENLGHDLDLSRSPDVIAYVTIRLVLFGLAYWYRWSIGTFLLSLVVTHVFWCPAFYWWKLLHISWGLRGQKGV